MTRCPAIDRGRQCFRFTGKKDRGFTLIEVLIASSLLGVLMLLLFSGLRTGSRIWSAGENNVEETAQMLVVQNFLRNHLASTLVLKNNQNIEVNETGNFNEEALPETDDPGQTENTRDAPQTRGMYPAEQEPVSFQGSKQAIQFISVMPASAGFGGPQMFKVSLQENESWQLMVSIMPLGSDQDHPVDSLDEVMILDNVEKFAINYWGVGNFSNEPEWHEEWRESYLPQLVRIEIAVENQPDWPVLIVSPRLAKRSAFGG